MKALTAKYRIGSWLEVQSALQFLMSEGLVELVSEDPTTNWYRIRR